MEDNETMSAVGSPATMDIPEEELLPIARERPRAGFTMRGVFRLYFNRHGAKSLAWCVAPDDGSWEMALQHVELLVDSRTVFMPKEEADEDDGRPSAWIACIGELELKGDGTARISP